MNTIYKVVTESSEDIMWALPRPINSVSPNKFFLLKWIHHFIQKQENHLKREKPIKAQLKMNSKS